MLNHSVPSETAVVRRKRMVQEMSNLRTLKWIGVAFGIHVVLLVATSMPTILGFFRGSVAATTPNPSTAPSEPATQPATAPPKPVASTDSASPGRPAGKSDEDKRMDDLARNGNPEAKKLTETAKPPKEPNSPGFKLNEDP